MDDHKATESFFRARRQAGKERLLARLRGRSADLQCFGQVSDFLVPETSRKLGTQEIPLAAIVGSVDRCGDYTLGFLPLNDSDRKRWTGVLEAVAAARHLPPIRVYRVGVIYFVVDGHHRVSVARQRGQTHIAAMVTDIETTWCQNPLTCPTCSDNPNRGECRTTTQTP